MRERLDHALVTRRLAASRSRARSIIREGFVSVDGLEITKPGATVSADAIIAVSPEAGGFVSRGARKLAHGLDVFGIEARGKVALDIGASTGGFTEVLLERGASHVFALDVGHGQLHERLREHRRVTSMEGINARDLSAALLPQSPEIVVCDVSFISLRIALPPALGLAAPGADLIALIKPQFEVGRAGVAKGGIVRDCALHERACTDIVQWLDNTAQWRVLGVVEAPVTGGDGNREFLIGAHKSDVG